MGWAVIDGCYRSRWRDGKHMHWTKNFSFLKKNLLHLLHIFQHTKNVSTVLVHNVAIIGTTTSCVFSAFCSNYVLHAYIFSTQQPNTMSYFCLTLQGLVRKMSSWLKINKRGGGLQKECPGMHFLKKQ